MTRQLEEELGLPPYEEDNTADIEEHEEQSATMLESLSTAEKLDNALAAVTGVDKHDKEMEEISGHALASYKDLVELGKNSPLGQSGRIYEVAGQMLKHALDARNSKADRKIKLLELQMKKLKIEQDSGEGEGARKGEELDRNELLSLIRSNAQPSEQSDDK
jgi:hypothetical protein